MIRRWKRTAALTAILLVLAMMTGLVASCGNGTNPSPVGTDASSATTESTGNTDDSVTDEPINYKDYLPEADYVDADVKFFLMESRRDQFDPENSGQPSVISSAIYERNVYVEKTYGVYLDFVSTSAGWSAFHEQCQIDLWAATAEFDIVVPDYYYTCETSGYFLNLLDLDPIHFENPYWVSGWNDNVTINNKIFSAVSYYTLDPITKAEVLFANNYLGESVGVSIEDIREMIWDGEWTVEEMMIAMEKANFNRDGVEDWTFQDNYGLAYNIWGGRAMLFSAGLTIAGYTPETGLIDWKYSDQSNVDIFQQMYAFFNNNTYSYYGGGGGMAELPESDRNLFLQNRALFAANSVAFSSTVAQYLDNYTVLPMPKRDADQLEYITTLLGSCVFGIMKTAKNPEMSATILEAMSILTYTDIIPVEYETVLKIRYQTDKDAGEMIDLIFSNIAMDFAFINSSNFNDVGTKPFDLIVEYNRNFVSGMTRITNELETKLETFLAAYADEE